MLLPPTATHVSCTIPACRCSVVDDRIDSRVAAAIKNTDMHGNLTFYNPASFLCTAAVHLM
jgi:hypothetical protein